MPLRAATVRDAVLFAETRAVVPLRAATLRDVAVFVVLPRVAVVVPRVAVPRAPTLRDAVDALARDAAVFVAARDVVARAETLRDALDVRDVALLVARFAIDDCARDAVVPVPRDAVVLRALDAARGDAVAVAVTAGAIGSANTARIDRHVEHTKNAPASKNTVPTAFLIKSVIFRRCIFCLPHNNSNSPCVTQALYNYIIFFQTYATVKC